MHQEWCDNLAKKVNELQTQLNKDKKIVLSPSIPFTLYLSAQGLDGACVFPSHGCISKLLILVPPLEPKQQVTVFVEVMEGTQVTTNSFKITQGLTTVNQNISVKPGTLVRAKFTSETLGMWVAIGGVYETTAFNKTKLEVIDEGTDY